MYKHRVKESKNQTIADSDDLRFWKVNIKEVNVLKRDKLLILQNIQYVKESFNATLASKGEDLEEPIQKVIKYDNLTESDIYCAEILEVRKEN